MAKRSCTVRGSDHRIVHLRGALASPHLWLGVRACSGNRYARITLAAFRKLCAVGLAMCDEIEKGAK